MSVFLVSQLTIHDREEYSLYESQFMEIFDRFEGKLLSVDDNPTVLSGEWKASRSVIAEFPDKKSLMAWLMSEDYQRISKHREAASTSMSIIANDLAALENA
jgi:uncharacterized protein (DUF1330 family)